MTQTLTALREQLAHINRAQDELEALRTPVRLALQRAELRAAAQNLADAYPGLSLIVYDWAEGGVLIPVALLDHDDEPLVDPNSNDPATRILFDALPVFDPDTPRADWTIDVRGLRFPAVFDVDLLTGPID